MEILENGKMSGKGRVSICPFLSPISLYIRNLDLQSGFLLYWSTTRNTKKAKTSHYYLFLRQPLGDLQCIVVSASPSFSYEFSFASSTSFLAFSVSSFSFHFNPYHRAFFSL